MALHKALTPCTLLRLPSCCDPQAPVSPCPSVRPCTASHSTPVFWAALLPGPIPCLSYLFETTIATCHQRNVRPNGTTHGPHLCLSFTAGLVITCSVWPREMPQPFPGHAPHPGVPLDLPLLLRLFFPARDPFQPKVGRALRRQPAALPIFCWRRHCHGFPSANMMKPFPFIGSR